MMKVKKVIQTKINLIEEGKKKQVLTKLLNQMKLLITV